MLEACRILGLYKIWLFCSVSHWGTQFESKCSIGGCPLNNSSSVSWRNGQRRNLFLEQGTCCWFQTFLLEDTKVVFNGCWPHAHSLAPRNVLCLGRTQSSGQSLWGGEKPALQVLGLSPSGSCQKKGSVLTLGFPPSPRPGSVNCPVCRRRLIFLSYNCCFFAASALPWM